MGIDSHSHLTALLFVGHPDGNRLTVVPSLEFDLFDLTDAVPSMSAQLALPVERVKWIVNCRRSRVSGITERRSSGLAP